MKKTKVSYKTTWDLTPLFKNDTDPEMGIEKKLVEKKAYEFINKWKDRKDYLTESKVLKEALDEFEIWSKNYGTEGKQAYYLMLRTSLDQSNSELKAKVNKLNDFGLKIENDIQFFTHRLAKIPIKKQKEFLTYKPLQIYKHFLEKLFEESKYLLSEAEEKILNLKSQTSFSNWVKMTEEFISKEERIVLTKDEKKKKLPFTEIIDLIRNQNKTIRDIATKEINSILKGYADVAEHELNSILQDKKVDDELRKVARPDLIRHISDDIDSKTVDALIETVSSRYKLSRRFYKLKAKLLGVKKLKYSERALAYGKVSRNYTFDQGVDLVSKTFNALDPEFAQIFINLVQSGNLDVYPKKGKSNGAFCINYASTTPIYILLNHTDDLHSVRTIAHESGHAINETLMNRSQNELNIGSPKSVAEVSSTFMEDLIYDVILKEADDETKLVIMMEKLDNDTSSIMRQTAFYKFEQELHKEFREKGYLPKKAIGKIFVSNLKAYMGEAVEMKKGTENWWIYVGHFRRFFYVYSYASGALISKSLQNSVKRDSKFIEKVKSFMSAGTSDSPKNIFMKLGVDISDPEFWDRGLDEYEALLNKTEELAKKLGKI